MELEYIDHEDLGVTPEFVQARISRLANDDTAYDELVAWWEKKKLPQGLQVVAMHGYPSLRLYVLDILQERGIEDKSDELIVDCALLVDNMIH